MADNFFDQVSYLKFLNTIQQAVNANADDTNPNGNTIIQYFDAPFDQLTFGSTILTSNIPDPNANIVWASSSVNSGFTWDNDGLWDPIANATSQYIDQITLSASTTVTSAFPSDIRWASSTVESNWSWNMGGVYDNGSFDLTLLPVINPI